MDTETFISDRQLGERYQCHRTTIWRWARNGKFPPPISLAARVTRWRMSDVLAWEQRRVAA